MPKSVTPVTPTLRRRSTITCPSSCTARMRKTNGMDMSISVTSMKIRYIHANASSTVQCIETGTRPHVPSDQESWRMSSSLQRYVQPLRARDLARLLVAGICVTDHADRRIVPQHALEAPCRGGCPVADDDHSGMLGVAHAHAAAVVDRHPRGAPGRREERVQQRPVGNGVRAVLHGFGLAVRARHRAGVEVIAA